MKLQSLFFALAIRLTGAAPTFDSSRHIWFTFPTFESSLSIGNGRVAGSIYGGAYKMLRINENSIWSGPFQVRIASTAPAAESVVREMLLAGYLSEGREYMYEHMISNVTSPRSFSYFGSININFGHAEGEIKDYVRWLDTWEYIANYPTGVLAARFNASAGGELNMSISITGTIVILSITAWTTLIITNASIVDMFFDAETSYRYASEAAWEAEMQRKINAAFALGYNTVKSATIADTTALLGHVTLNLGTSPNSLADLSTDQRLVSVLSCTSSKVVRALARRFALESLASVWRLILHHESGIAFPSFFP
ncbi:glycosyl hydrolase family 65, N-terminal domain-containing protein [Mycena vulgaris]|nr:glycosyl hydrolase family 65, N-terminal domain-containing protein [Mycena vulgaris]KAJ6522990.1 glycosyl hydrolase family 65, N-terminal domain-containing protein [Mycena vulgaris]